MNKILFFALFLTCGPGVYGQQIQLNNDRCTHCTMLIKDEHFAALAEEPDGQISKFDAIECLINFLKEKPENTFEKIFVADYSNGQLTEAQSATYLKSNAIPSPMGAYLSGFSDKETAKKVQKEMGGELYTWDGIIAKFADSRFGKLDHPDHHHGRPDAYAPIGMMGDHVHHRGSAMLSVRYMYMTMNGNLKGSADIDHMSIHQHYMVAPEAMGMHMYMLGAMYAPTDKLTFMLMQSFVQKEMQVTSMMGMDFRTESGGLGDTKISALYSLSGNEKASFHLNSGVSIPTGKINRKDDTPTSEDMLLPYPMQPGSGTVDLSIGATFRQAFKKTSWGVQQISTFRTGKNAANYHIGNEYTLNAWGSYSIASWVSLSGRVEGAVRNSIQGQDDELNPMMAPAANTANSGFTRVRTYLGSNISFSSHPALQNIKLGVEYGLPVYQRVNGIQMAEANTFNAGVRYML